MPGPRPAYGWTEGGKGNVAMTVLWTGMAACALVCGLLTGRGEAVAAAETDSLLSRVYHGSVNLLVSNLLERERLSRADLDALYALLDEKKEE